MPCLNCSASLAEGARFCMHCGSSQVTPTQAAGYAQGNVQGYTPGYAPGNGQGYPQGYAQGFPSAMLCPTCRNDGSGLPTNKVYCSTCRWLRPLGPAYELPVEAFLWRLDADAMNVLRSLGPLTAAAQTISERVGRRWFESSVNGLRLSERQLPDVFDAAIRAARIVGLPYLPELYISGDQMWDAITLGTENSAFIVIGSVLLNFKEEELLFVLGREMGHCRAGHALWKTVMQFISGRSQKRSIMGDGLLKMLSPAKLIENAIDVPLMAWARHAEITADNAGILCTGNEAVARRVLQAWTFRSFPLLQRMNHDAWLEQEDAADDSLTQISEWTLASAPYLAGRLRLMRDFARSDYVKSWRAVIAHWMPPAPSAPVQSATAATAGTSGGAASSAGQKGGAPAPDPNTVRLVCAKCGEAMRIPKSAIEGKDSVNVRCPNANCRAVLTVSAKPTPAPASASASPPAATGNGNTTASTSASSGTSAPPLAPDPDSLRIVCAKCNEGMRIPVSALAGKESINVRCPNASCRAILLVKSKPGAAAPSGDASQPGDAATAGANTPSE